MTSKKNFLKYGIPAIGYSLNYISKNEQNRTYQPSTIFAVTEGKESNDKTEWEESNQPA